ncbi:MAG: aconitate hydratase AcnA [Armatimonadota bacterium]
MNSFGARSTVTAAGRTFEIFRLAALEEAGLSIGRLPYSLRILLENLLRQEDGVSVTAADVEALARWDPAVPDGREIAFMPARVLMQDFTGVPAVVDLAAMRDAMAELGGDPGLINPLLPVELVIDHSMQVDVYGSPDALRINRELDYGRNTERYTLLRWAQQSFGNFKVVPPYTGICHQVNLEYLARVVFTSDENPASPAGDYPLAYPDTLVGTDSHTPMVNGLGVLGWGVGGLEAEAAMLGQQISMLTPQVIGFRLEGSLREGATATDLVLTVTEMLRKKGVVGKFVEFYGPGVGSVALADRATIGNMSPEYGATCAIFPVDEETLRYLRFTGRPEERVALVETYMKEQGLFHSAGAPEPVFTDTLALDLASVEPSIAGPRRPQDRVPLSGASQAFRGALESLRPSPFPVLTQKNAAVGVPGTPAAEGVWGEESRAEAESANDYGAGQLDHGAVVIASITSCTNTSNPSVMLGAGLLARKAAERGLRPKPWVKTSLAPGSMVVTDYLERGGLTPYLEELGFHLVGYGCATCIGNSGPLPAPVSEAIAARHLVVCSVLSGNRNFEGRIHSEVRANYLMSPPLVIAYALAGRMDWDPANEPLGTGADGQPVFLRDIWPGREEIRATMERAIESEMFRRSYAEVYAGDEVWRSLPAPGGERFQWDPASTYIKRPPFLESLPRRAPDRVPDVSGARVIALLGDSVTTDHISPAGSIRRDSPAGRYLLEHGVETKDFNSYGARRGNHEVMVRGTFANVRIRNRLAPEMEGGFTTHFPTGEVLTIYEAAERYREAGTPLLVLAGREYGSGSSRDWAAKGPALQGIRAVLAESYERIHRSNLIGMGILPLQFRAGDSVETLGLTGRETFELAGLSDATHPEAAAPREVRVRARGEDGSTREFTVAARIDTPQEALYYRHGGILQYVLRQLAEGRGGVHEVPGAIDATPQSTPGSHPTDALVDQNSIESFPASDSPAY